jgi:hypothetical protein
LASIAIAGYSVPDTVARITAALDAGNANVLDHVTGTLAAYAWVLAPVVGGLVIMGLGRVIMLLSAINRSLRGQS